MGKGVSLGPGRLLCRVRGCPREGCADRPPLEKEARQALSPGSVGPGFRNQASFGSSHWVPRELGTGTSSLSPALLFGISMQALKMSQKSALGPLAAPRPGHAVRAGGSSALHRKDARSATMSPRRPWGQQGGLGGVLAMDNTASLEVPELEGA